MLNQKRITTLNFASNLLAFLVTYSISFFLSPYIVRTLGTDAYGFVSLANNFVTYISLVTVALNSLASRFVSVRIFNNDYKGANRYYSSVIISNAILSLVLLIPCIWIVCNIERIITVPANLIFDVRVLFAIVFLSFFITMLTSLFSVAVFVEKKLYLNAARNIEGAIIRCICIIVLFVIFPAKIYFVSLTALIVSLYSILWNFHYTRKFLPKLRLDRHNFDTKSVKELLKSGVWNLVSQLSYILNNGLDLLLCNQFISSVAMGVLSISQTLPTIVNSVMSAVSSIFNPNLTEYYAKGNQKGMMDTLKSSIRYMSMMLVVPLAGLTVFGECFYALWQPTQNSSQLQILSVLKVLCLILTGSLASIHEIFVIVNKLKPQAIATLISGVVSILFTFVLLKTTNMGVYAVAGVSSVVAIARNLLFTFPYAAKCMNQKWYVFYPLAFRSVFFYLIICGICLAYRFLLPVNSWATLICAAVVCMVLGLTVNLFLLLKKQERKNLLNSVKKRLSRRKTS